MHSDSDFNIYLRPLETRDALVSWRWRNDPEIWRFTGRRPDREITPEIEVEWLKGALEDDRSRRFAICIARNGEYVGNVQLTSISNNDAELHLFIGAKHWWGKGIATKATKLILEYAAANLSIRNVYLSVNPDNIAAIRAYEKCGFIRVDGTNKMICELP